MKRISSLLLACIIGLFCGFCHAESVNAVTHKSPIVIVDVKPAAVVSEEDKYQEYRAHMIDVLARVIMSENGQKDNDCKQATAQTVLNRLTDGRWGHTIDEVVNYPNAYSTYDNGDPNVDCYIMAEWTLDHPNVFPINMFYFREGDYHEEKEGLMTDYRPLNGTYFSTEGEPIWK